jgi:superfamily II DNA or RNA helicase
MTSWFKKQYSLLEFRKGALALLPESGDTAGTAFHVARARNNPEYDFCTCGSEEKVTCVHRKSIGAVLSELEKSGIKNLNDAFRMSVWDMLAGILNEALRFPRENSRVTRLEENGDTATLRFFMGETQAAAYTSTSERCAILLDRLGLECPDSDSRRNALDKLDLLSLSENERIMFKKGIKSRRQTLEGSFWYTFCYHLFFDWNFDDGLIKAGIRPESGDFFIANAEEEDDRPRFTLDIPRPSVPHVLLGLKSSIDNAHEFSVSPFPLKSILKMSLTKKKDLLMALWFRYSPENGEATAYSREKLLPFTYGDLVYLSDKSCFARIEKPDVLFEKFKGKYAKIVKQEKIPEGLDSLGEAFWGRKGLNIVDETLKELSIFKTHDRLILDTKAADRSWFHLSMAYGFGRSRISIFEILNAKKEGRRFIPVDKGWVDVRAVDTDALSLPGLDLKKQLSENRDPMTLSLADVFRVMAGTGKPTDIEGDQGETLARKISMNPAETPDHVPGLKSRLRDYQVKGFHWMLYLYENGLSGILCDDMGLGKTHQIMALMVYLKEVRKERKPFLVVAPVTVLSHWETKLSEYAPSLETITHHGLERDVAALKGHDVILTSFGVLRRDSFDSLTEGFSLAVFDEAQHVKNPRTLVYRAAWSIRADMKLCATGTPVENSLTELKALMDLAVPGYLGPDDAFETRYVKPVMQENNREKRDELARLVKPFTLRRMKKSVLLELPQKIEDIRTCRLSEDQVRLYRQTIADKGQDVRRMLERSDSVPFIHIFAILSLLKQICDHPALALKTPDQAESYESGKWDLFREILDQALESGQKIVVYSQYVDMVRMVENHLKTLGVKGVSLTGATRNRGELIRRFNEDPDCRVFVGSLLAGGTGIDLVSASVVIHYDRWWNAAKEDQATDRVHRIGQRRGVQVFKLVTQGTLEEKIASMIEKKKDLMDSVVQEDDPNILKAFTRDQLLSLLSMPGEE